MVKLKGGEDCSCCNRSMLCSPGHNFWCHPVRRAHHGVSLAPVPTKLSAETKVSQLDSTNHTKQHVVTLDVTVDDATAMQKLQGFQTFTRHCCYLTLLQQIKTEQNQGIV